MSESDNFDGLIDRLRQGDNAAATEVYNRFARQLISQAQRRFEGRLQAKADPSGIVQSAFNSLFGRVKDGQFDLPDWDSLWHLLVHITLRKCGHRVEYFQAEKRDVRNEFSPAMSDRSAARWEPIARDPLPEEAVLLTETLELLLVGLEPDDRDVLALRLGSHTVPEISQHTGRSERTIERVLERARKRLIRMQAEEA